MTRLSQQMRFGRGPLIAGLAASLGVHAAVMAAVLAGDFAPPRPEISVIPVELVATAPAQAPAAPAANSDPVPSSAVLPPTPPAHSEPQRSMPAEPASEARKPVEAAVVMPPVPAARPAKPEPPGQPAAAPTVSPADVEAHPSIVALPSSSGEANESRTGPAPSGDDDEAATPLAGNPVPTYPYGARARGQEGRVMLEVRVAADGSVADVSIARSSGVNALDRAAVKAVRRWRFHPAEHRGQPVPAALELPVTFKLEDRQTAER